MAPIAQQNLLRKHQRSCHLNLGDPALAWISFRMVSRSYSRRLFESDSVLCASETSRNSFSAASFCPGPLALSGWKRSASCLHVHCAHEQPVYQHILTRRCWS